MNLSKTDDIRWEARFQCSSLNLNILKVNAAPPLPPEGFFIAVVISLKFLFGDTILGDNQSSDYCLRNLSPEINPANI